MSKKQKKHVVFGPTLVRQISLDRHKEINKANSGSRLEERVAREEARKNKSEVEPDDPLVKENTEKNKFKKDPEIIHLTRTKAMSTSEMAEAIEGYQKNRGQIYRQSKSRRKPDNTITIKSKGGKRNSEKRSSRRRRTNKRKPRSSIF